MKKDIISKTELLNMINKCPSDRVEVIETLKDLVKYIESKNGK